MAYLKLEKWQDAVHDFARVVTEKTTDVDLLSKAGWCPCNTEELGCRRG